MDLEGCAQECSPRILEPLVEEEDQGVWGLTGLLETPALPRGRCGLLEQSLQALKLNLGGHLYVLEKLGVPATIWVLQ